MYFKIVNTIHGTNKFKRYFSCFDKANFDVQGAVFLCPGLPFFTVIDFVSHYFLMG